LSRKVLPLVVATLALLPMLTPAADASARLRNGRFWLTCQLSHRLPDDPIVYPGRPGAAHGHDFYGNKTTDAASSYAEMRGGGTTCARAADTAGYWSPTLLVESAPVGIRVINVYYWGIRGRTEAFPPDFRVIAGATVGVPSGTATGSRKVGWMCIRAGPVYAAPPDCGTEYLRMIVTFPSCWDGVGIDAPDHHSHLTYPSGKVCPSSHPVMLPRLVLHVVYDTHDGTTAELSSDMAMGSPPGTSVHADFWNTWDQPELERLVDSCINIGPNCAFKGS
jgi:Domain of unknown function (DUF1996)